MNKRIEGKILKIYKQVFNQVFTKETLEKAEKGDKKAVQRALVNIQTSEKYKEFCKKFATALAKYGLSREKGLWKRYYEAAKAKGMYGLPALYTEFEKKVLRQTINKNFTMIKSIPDSIMKVWKQKDVSTLLNQVLLGKVGRGTFERQLRKHGAKNAKLIARTETAKLQAATDEIRAKSLKSVGYLWLSSNDQRTRPSHRAMNRVFVFWRKDSEKPKLDNMQGNAGEFPNCRCSREIIFNIDDLKDNNYKVYDYRSHKIIKMNKKALEKSFSKGELVN